MSDRKTKGLKDFNVYYDELLTQIARAALKIPEAQLDMKIDAAKVLTAAKSVKNRTPDEDEGDEIRRMRAEMENPTEQDLLDETPEPDEEETPDE